MALGVQVDLCELGLRDEVSQGLWQWLMSLDDLSLQITGVHSESTRKPLQAFVSPAAKTIEAAAASVCQLHGAVSLGKPANVSGAIAAIVIDPIDLIVFVAAWASGQGRDERAEVEPRFVEPDSPAAVMSIAVVRGIGAAGANLLVPGVERVFGPRDAFDEVRSLRQQAAA